MKHSHELVGIVETGEVCPISENQEHLLYMGSWWPLDIHPMDESVTFSFVEKNAPLKTIPVTVKQLCEPSNLTDYAD